jgi:hypothetical protein
MGMIHSPLFHRMRSPARPVMRLVACSMRLRVFLAFSSMPLFVASCLSKSTCYSEEGV